MCRPSDVATGPLAHGGTSNSRRLRRIDLPVNRRQWPQAASSQPPPTETLLPRAEPTQPLNSVCPWIARTGLMLLEPKSELAPVPQFQAEDPLTVPTAQALMPLGSRPTRLEHLLERTRPAFAEMS